MAVVEGNEILHKNFSNPDQTMNPPKTKVEIINLGGFTFSRYTFQPGWKWSVDIKPLAKTDYDPVPHVAYVISGRVAIQLAGGKEVVVGPGDVNLVPGNHDGWVVGDEPCVYLTIDMPAGK